jgi:hypothetical protein
MGAPAGGMQKNNKDRRQPAKNLYLLLLSSRVSPRGMPADISAKPWPALARLGLSANAQLDRGARTSSRHYHAAARSGRLASASAQNAQLEACAARWQQGNSRAANRCHKRFRAHYLWPKLRQCGKSRPRTYWCARSLGSRRSRPLQIGYSE